MKKVSIILIVSALVLGISEQSYAAKSKEECFNLGLEYYDEQNYTEAVKWYRKAAEQGDTDAQSALDRLTGSGK